MREEEEEWEAEWRCSRDEAEDLTCLWPWLQLIVTAVRER